MIKNKELHELRISLSYLLKELKEYDNYIYGHCKRVAEYSKSIGKSLGLDSYQCEQIYLGALLHDVGKLEISKDIINKPGRLDYKEYNLIKEHTSIGYSILEETGLLKEFPIILNIVLCHHERLDGTGYPLGVKKIDIPLETRIVGIADSYDAMTSKRSYCVNMTKAEAIDELKRCEKMYDQEVVEVFANILLKGVLS